jgi:hypothetical protein
MRGLLGAVPHKRIRQDGAHDLCGTASGTYGNSASETKGAEFFVSDQLRKRVTKERRYMGSRKAEGFVGREAMTQRLRLAMRGKSKNAKSMVTR